MANVQNSQLRAITKSYQQSLINILDNANRSLCCRLLTSELQWTTRTLSIFHSVVIMWFQAVVITCTSKVTGNDTGRMGLAPTMLAGPLLNQPLAIVGFSCSMQCTGAC